MGRKVKYIGMEVVRTTVTLPKAYLEAIKEFQHYIGRNHAFYISLGQLLVIGAQAKAKELSYPLVATLGNLGNAPQSEEEAFARMSPEVAEAFKKMLKEKQAAEQANIQNKLTTPLVLDTDIL